VPKGYPGSTPEVSRLPTGGIRPKTYQKRGQFDHRTSERFREKIKVGEVLHRLQRFALGEEGIHMTPAQVRAAIALIEKRIADPPRIVEGTGPDGAHTLTIEFLNFDKEILDK
jgi:hypothetical protein